MYRGTYYLNPDYGHDSHDAHDVVVIVLDDLIYDIAPATLPPADLSPQVEAGVLVEQQL